MHVLTVLSGPANHFSSSHPDCFRPSPCSSATIRSRGCMPSGRRCARGSAPRRRGAGRLLPAQHRRGLPAAHARSGRGARTLLCRKEQPDLRAAPARARLRRRKGDCPRPRLPRRHLLDAGVRFRKRQSLNFQRDDADVEAFTLRIVDEYPAARGDVGRAAQRRRCCCATAILIAEPHASLRRVAEYAGIDASPAVIERMAETLRLDDYTTRAHRTTDNGPRSIPNAIATT